MISLRVSMIYFLYVIFTGAYYNRKPGPEPSQKSCCLSSPSYFGLHNPGAPASVKNGSVSQDDDCAWVHYVQWTGLSPGADPANWDTITYKYDLSGRRIRKNVDGYTTTYLYDGDHVIAEYDGNNNLVRKYVYGPRVDEPVCMIDVADSNAVYYYHYDGLGSVVALSDTEGDTVQTYEYSIYGHVAAEDPNHPNPYLFTGRRFDVETGLYYYRARYYSPYIGRFLQTDPVAYGYAYCGNNPVGCVDPSGLFTLVDLVKRPVSIIPWPTKDEDDKRVDISLCAKTHSVFYESYGMRVTPGRAIKFGTGKEFLVGLIFATTFWGPIGNLYVFSHGWLYGSADARMHNGGFWGQGPGDPSWAGFYGVKSGADHEDARDLMDLEILIKVGLIKFAPEGKIFLEGCRVGAYGTFASELGRITKRKVIAAYGGSNEADYGKNWVRFRSAPETIVERLDGQYDGWMEFDPLGKKRQIGEYITVPNDL